ncbi:MAG: multi-sensor signal transduction histidine kinase [Puniceicoccaceae bacterium 5H]|nr:MAG: multi-sensor signal transduction histidine kinase [Puniceicoccaceae bacterium 5H]
MRLAPLILLLLCLGCTASGLWAEENTSLSKEDLKNAIWHFDLQEALAEPEHVYKLDLSRQELDHFPLEVTRLPHLRVLLLNHNHIPEIPPEIARLDKLVELELNDNVLEALPSELFTITTLSELEASRNRIRALPSAISQLHQLTEIELNENRLTRIPDSIGQLQELEELKVERNQLTELPNSILQITQLGELIIGSNQLTELWPDIGRLENLRDLDISNNNLRSVPPTLFDFHLNLFYLKNNPWERPFRQEEIEAILHAEENDFADMLLGLAEAGRAEQAHRYLDTAEAYYRAEERWSDLAYIYLIAAFMHRDLGSLDEAFVYTRRAEELAEEINFDLESADDWDAFYANTTEIIRDAENLQELLESEREKAQLRANVRRGLILGIILLLGFSGFVYWSRRRLQRYNRTLAAQRGQIAKQAEQLERVNANLTERQAETLAQKAQIEQQARDLKRLNHTKDRIFSIVGHDLRNPLYAMESLAEIMEREDATSAPEERRHRAQLIQRSAQEASLLLNNLLDWARTQTNDIPYRPDFVHPAALVQATLDLLQPALQHKHIRVVSEIRPETVVFADPHMLQTVFRNLIGNAIKFSHQDGVIHLKEQNGETYHDLEIIDEGVGMEQRDAENLLRRERITSASGTRGERGSGLGLLICREFVARNEGQLLVRSAPDSGTRFCIRLPKIGLNLAEATPSAMTTQTQIEKD